MERTSIEGGQMMSSGDGKIGIESGGEEWRVVSGKEEE